jgi:hypothetical protein
MSLLLDSIGANVYQESDAPRYLKGNLAMAILSLAVCFLYGEGNVRCAFVPYGSSFTDLWPPSTHLSAQSSPSSTIVRGTHPGTRPGQPWRGKTNCTTYRPRQIKATDAWTFDLQPRHEHHVCIAHTHTHTFPLRLLPCLSRHQKYLIFIQFHHLQSRSPLSRLRTPLKGR